MSFVGTRPEVVKYVKKYKPEYFATLLFRNQHHDCEILCSSVHARIYRPQAENCQ